MKEERITKEDLMQTLTECLSICRPDEYQSRHNLLVRQLASYLLYEEIEKLEENEE